MVPGLREPLVQEAGRHAEKEQTHQVGVAET